MFLYFIVLLLTSCSTMHVTNIDGELSINSVHKTVHDGVTTVQAVIENPQNTQIQFYYRCNFSLSDSSLSSTKWFVGLIDMNMSKNIHCTTRIPNISDFNIEVSRVY